jgi:O-antigen ligase
MRVWLDSVRKNPLEFIMGICVLLIAAAGGAARDLASTALAIMFISSLLYMKEWKVSWHSLGSLEKLLLAGFVLYTLSGLLSWVNTSDHSEFVKQFGRYIRFTLIIPVYLVVRYRQLSLSRYFIVGVLLSGFIYLGFALHSIYKSPELPATGYYHHITFGDAAMVSAGLMVAMFLFFEDKPLIKSVIGISIVCAICASILSQARGAWLMLPIYFSIALIYYSSIKKSYAIRLVVVLVVACIATMLSPAGKIIDKRYDEAKTEITQFMDGQRADTSVGGRFAMWVIGYNVWRENPVFGTGLGDFDEDMIRYQKKGEYPNVAVMGSTHNIFMQALVGTGIIGFVILCYALVIAPLRLFFADHGLLTMWGMMGAILTVSYSVFGLSESWILRAPAVSIYLAYMITLMGCYRITESEMETRDNENI